MGSGNHNDGDDKSDAPGTTTPPAQGVAATTTTSTARANIDVRVVDEFGQTELHRAAKAGDTARVILLIDEYGAEIDVRDNDGWTPLLTSCIERKTDVVLALLERNANPNIGDTKGLYTPLMMAAGNLDTILVEALVEHHAALDIESTDQHRTAMHWAACADAVHAGMKLNVIEILLKHHAAVTVDTFGHNPGGYLAHDDLSFEDEFNNLVQEYSIIGES